MAVVTQPAVEQVIRLGPRRSLVGIVTPGAAVDPPGVERPRVVVLNSGIVHRVGTHRMSVTLARALAASGMTVLRFDFSGIGDSEARTDGLGPLDASLADIREALDSFAPSSGSRVILVGLCSGADQALIYAGTDDRVTGLVLLDPTTPRTRGYYWRYFVRRAVSVRTWRNVLRLRHPWIQALRRVQPRAPAPQSAAPDPDSVEVHDYLRRAYEAALARGVHMLAVLTSGRDHRQNYRKQLLDAFPTVNWGTQLDLVFFHPCDHTFTPEAQRRRLVELVSKWACQTRFSSEASPVARAQCVVLSLGWALTCM